MAAPLLEAHTLTYAVQGRTLLDAVSLTIEAGELLALVGPNGAGKSTLLALLAGDLHPDGGTILLDGAPLARLRPCEQSLRRAVLRQRSGVSLPFSAYEVALMGRSPHLRGRAEGPADHAITRDALARTELLPYAERIVPTLSGGEQARVSMARVLAQQAPLLLLDEPTAALDLRHQHRALQLARAVAANGGAALVVLHDLNLAALYADRIAVLHEGRLRACGEPWAALRPDLLSAVYGVAVTVLPHPHLDAPLVLTLPAQLPDQLQEHGDALTAV
jgi:iron complex transport system ATP-binding protein